jgi:hypothetical protein
MLPRRRCPFCHRWFRPHPRLEERQKTCGRPECRREQKRRFNQKWRNKHPDYFRGTYALQKEKYGTRAEEKRRLLTAQRSFRSKLAPATETSACKSHKS